MSYGASEFLSQAKRSILVSGAGMRNGNGLAFFRHHNVRDGRAEAWTESAVQRSGITVCGGRGRHSVRTPDELRDFSEQTGLSGEELARASRLTARVDNNTIGDGFQLYLPSFVITKSGELSVVQQGMNEQSRLARRYHWHSASVRDFTSEPHTAIVAEPQGEILNLVDRRPRKPKPRW